jgi:hypothetical protein
MPRSNRLPARFPIDTKYVLEARGDYVRRYVEFPDGHTVELKPRKARTCDCADQRLVPEIGVGSRRLLAAVA